jgi:hypothetical protein
MFLNNFDFELRDLKGLDSLTLDGYFRNTDFRQIRKMGLNMIEI